MGEPRNSAVSPVDVAGLGKPEVFRAGDQPDLRERRSDRLGGASGAGIVEDHRLKPRLMGLGMERLKACKRQIAGVVADHDHGQLRAGRLRRSRRGARGGIDTHKMHRSQIRL